MEFGNQLSHDADTLARRIERDSDRPHYTEVEFERKLRRARAKDALRPPDSFVPSEATLYLRRRDFERVVQGAGLTERQLEVFLERTSGDTWEEIGRRHGHSKQGACKIFRQAMKKVRRALRENPFRGLATVYRQEVTRFTPIRPKLR